MALIQKWLKGIDFEKSDGHLHITPLCVAVDQVNNDVVRLLLQRGANPNKAENGVISPIGGATPLILAALQDNREGAQLLLEHGALPNSADADGNTPLHVAAKPGHKDMVKFLMDNGAGPNNVDKRGKTPLHSAAMMSYYAYDEGRYSMEDMLEVVQLLIERGGDPNRIDDEGRTPLSEASHPVAYLGIMQILMDAGADPAYRFR